MPKKLPLGLSDFASLRLGNGIYIDKTDLIYKLAADNRKIFLARPRRFGKSLLVSTFDSLFRDGLKYFSDLKIEKLWDDKIYPVVRLDFSIINNFDNVEVFTRKFYDILIDKFQSIGFSYNKNGSWLISQLSSWLETVERNSIVLLIDEYDNPLTQCIDNPSLFKEIRSIMSEFYSTVKSNEGAFRFFFMTGIAKYTNTTIFSSFNNLSDISFDSRYSTILGYTEEEIRECFAPYIENAASVLNCTEKELMDSLRDYYDGFSFDASAIKHVYCPWSVLHFLENPEAKFSNYWYLSGGLPTVLVKYLTKHALSKPVSYSTNPLIQLDELNSSQYYDDLSPEVLLTQAGYYTIKSVNEVGTASIGYPNREVAFSMARLYMNEIVKKDRAASLNLTPIRAAFNEGRLDDVIKYFNIALDSIDYLRYPVKDEATCRAFLQFLLIGAAMAPKVEVHNALGRSDLEVEENGKAWVFEFKFARKSSDCAKLLNQAIEQMEARRYGLSSADKEITRVAVVFDGQRREINRWRAL